MTASFNSNLAKEACRQLQTLLDKVIILSLTEKDALAKYIHTLEVLIQKYPPYQQEDPLLKFSQKAGFIEGSSLFNQDVIERIEHHKKCIKCNYEHSSHSFYLRQKNNLLGWQITLLRKERNNFSIIEIWVLYAKKIYTTAFIY